jgi:myxalamid-type polyketide synthase MxaB
VFATAGSPRKRAFLQSMGVRHVMDSRSLTFADEIAALTSGGGVDLVLNSISGPAIERSLSALAGGGRFLEIGKNGIWTADEVARLRPDVRYSIVDLGGAILEDVGAIRATFVELLSRLEAGGLEPLPAEVFPLADATAAFRHMAAARHIGKIVIVPAASGQAGAAADFACSPGAAYVVTGGFGGLGLATARWLATRGATRLMLIGRRKPAGAALDQVRQLRSAGIDVIEEFGDVSSRSFLSSALARVAGSGHRLGGIVHAAGVLADAPVQQLSWQQYAEVWAPKVAGAWNLHLLTADQPLEFFVMFSSMSAVLGAAGQSSYTASNAFVDALAHARRARGLPGISINWGPWAEVGMAANLTERERERWLAQGIGMISPEQGLRALEHALAIDLPQISVLPIDWRRFLASDGRASLSALRTIAQGFDAQRQDSAAARSFPARLAAADPHDRPELLLEHVREAVGAVLALDGSRLSETQGLTDIGMDSLMAVELSNRLSASIGKPLPTTLAFEQPTVAALTMFVGGLLGLEPRSAPRPDAETSTERAAFDDVIGLTDEEVASSLAAELEQAGY